jgi:hypothetical protein
MKLLDKAHGVKAEMGIAPDLNQSRRLFDRVEKPDVLYWNAQLFTAGFVVLDDTKP